MRQEQLRAVLGYLHRAANPDSDARLVVDLDATLVTTHADKQDAAATYKRSYGHHPLLAMVAERGEILAVMLRPGNAGSNTASDHVAILGQAIDALPAAWRHGHQPDDDSDATEGEILVRADSAGASHWLAEECRDRNTRFSFVDCEGDGNSPRRIPRNGSVVV